MEKETKNATGCKAYPVKNCYLKMYEHTFKNAGNQNE